MGLAVWLVRKLPRLGEQRGGDEGVCELGSFAGDTVDSGGFDEGVARVAEGVPAHVVDEYEDEVGLGGGLGGEGGDEEAEGLATGEGGHGPMLQVRGRSGGREA